jgi:hypothetical protein
MSSNVLMHLLRVRYKQKSIHLSGFILVEKRGGKSDKFEEDLENLQNVKSFS